MVAALGYLQVQAGVSPTSLDVGADPALALT
jgi:hypothetical protein